MSFRETVDRLRSAVTRDSESSALVSMWQGEVARLYDEITQWLKPYVDDGSVELSRRPKTILEERIGTYSIDQLDIDIGTETVRLDPKATLVIGASGRIDISHLGSGAPMMLILTGNVDDRHWSIVNPAERKKLTLLDKDSFEAALDRLLEEYGTRSEPAM